MNGGFDWRSLGKADYAQAAALVASLPETIRAQLNGTEKETLCRITHLIWTSAQTGGRGRGYCVPSEKWLARKVQRSERTVRRCLTVLRELGLVSWIRRKGSGNEWLSNLYTLGKSFLASLFARSAKKPQQIHQRTKMSDNNLKKGYNAAPSLGSSVDNTRPKQIDKQAAEDKPPSHQLWKAPAWMTARS